MSSFDEFQTFAETLGLELDRRLQRPLVDLREAESDNDTDYTLPTSNPASPPKHEDDAQEEAAEEHQGVAEAQHEDVAKAETQQDVVKEVSAEPAEPQQDVAKEVSDAQRDEIEGFFFRKYRHPPALDQSGRDWNSPAALAAETFMATEAGVKYRDRGPPPPADGGPNQWRSQPYREHGKRWGSRGGKHREAWAQYMQEKGKGKSKGKEKSDSRQSAASASSSSAWPAPSSGGMSSVPERGFAETKVSP